jgi:hypothetical protein
MMVAVAIVAVALGVSLQISSYLRYRSRVKAVAAELDRSISMNFATEVPLWDALGVLASGVSNPALPDGLPVRFDLSLSAPSGGLLASPVSVDVEGAPLGTVLEQLLKPLGLSYATEDGFVTISTRKNEILTFYFKPLSGFFVRLLRDGRVPMPTTHKIVDGIISINI